MPGDLYQIFVAKEYSQTENLIFFILPKIEGHKTDRFAVRSAHDGSNLGTISWHGPWRQYIYAPESHIIWSDGCLKDLLAFMQKLRDDRKTPIKSKGEDQCH
jgi:hypothetical protein